MELPGAVPPELAERLLLRVIDMEDAEFRSAGIGRSGDFQKNRFVRSDEIHWFTGADELERDYLDWMESLREAMNRRLFLGLFDYECHFARYAPGAFYKKHLDAFQGRTNRVLSTVTYLNPGWTVADGGQLLIYDKRDGEEQVVDSILPLMGTLVVFLSDRVPHEVVVAHRQRYSIAGWFRVNDSINGQLNPPQ
ncbi:2OG-Fe(II) oxygenase [Spongiibacter sp. KMU-158]|uniref:2OG-Fe(II) oxygenase n=2 Tax=Spongiibacter pelagi TaxID=2760804 RepID=A0A927C065_9GAMM|nr:2OG-Fe(II) oxygenase [Spongiibacter pelagi]